MSRHLLDYIKRFDASSPHHIAAMQLLHEALPPALLERDADWIVAFEDNEQELNL